MWGGGGNKDNLELHHARLQLALKSPDFCAYRAKMTATNARKKKSFPEEPDFGASLSSAASVLLLTDPSSDSP